MSSLVGAMSIAVQALLAEQGALEVTSNNVANVNTPGYSRQRPVLAENNPIYENAAAIGTGVSLQRVESLRDDVLERQLQEGSQQQSSLDAYVAAMQQVQTLFNGSGTDIGNQLNAFFTSLDNLSTNPSSLSLRQGVLTSASNLTAAFRFTADGLNSLRTNLNLSVNQALDEVNGLTKQIAGINSQVAALERVGKDAGTFVDQRNVLIGKLAALVDVSVIANDTGEISLTTANGTALVAGEISFSLNGQSGSDGLTRITAGNVDITSNFRAGKIAGLVQARDQSIPSVLSSLDSLAAGLATALNTANASGFDLKANKGGDLFVPPPASGNGAAANFRLAITDPSLLAASSDGSPGSNGNLSTLSGVAKQAVANGSTPSDSYSNLVFQVGSEVANASAELEATAQMQLQLQNQRSAMSGVSLDEEASSLLQYQRAFEAAASVIAAINDLTQTLVNLGKD